MADAVGLGVQERNGGVHLAFLAGLLKSGSGHVAGGSLSIGDVAIWNVTDNHMQIFRQEITSAYPDLAKFHQQFAALPKVKAYLESNLRYQQNNANGLG